MDVHILSGIEGAKKAQGIVVIVDVYRAASVASYALAQGAAYIIPVATSEQAFAMKKKKSDVLLLGEERGIHIKGFDFGNSPHELIKHDLTGKTLVHRTSAGTQGLVNATQAEEVIFGSFPTASAISQYIREKNPKVVTIVAMDGKDSEDGVFAEYLKSLLEGTVSHTREELHEYLLKHEASARFLDPTLKEFPKEDIEYCLDIDRFKFISLVTRQNGQLRIIAR